MYLSLRSLDCRLEKRVGLTGEDKRETNFHAVNAYIVSDHITVYKVLFRTRINHLAQCICNEFWV